MLTGSELDEAKEYGLIDDVLHAEEEDEKKGKKKNSKAKDKD